MKTKTIYYAGILLFLIAGIANRATAQTVTKHSDIEPQHAAGFPFSKLTWLDEYKPLSYSEYCVTKFATNGTSVLFNKSYEVNGNTIDSYFDMRELGGYLIFNTYNYMFATDGLGNPVWAIEPYHHNSDAKIQAFCQSNSGEILIFHAKEKWGDTYLTIAEIELMTGNLINYNEFLLNIPTDIYRESVVTTVNRIPGEGYFLTLTASTNDAYTISFDNGLDIIGFNKQEFHFNGSNQPLEIHEILPTDDGEMFFITGLNDGSLSTPNGVLIGKLNFNHDFPVIKYIEPADGSNYFGQLLQERSLIVETDQSISVNLEVEGDGTISTLVDAATFSLSYYNGNKHLAALVQYNVDFDILAQTVAYDFGTSSDNVYNHNIIKDYRDRIHLKVGVGDSPSYASSPLDTCYYNILPENDFYDNCHAVSFEMSETDLEQIKNEETFQYAEDEYEIREADITHNNLEYDSNPDCVEERRPATGPTKVSNAYQNINVSIYPNPSTGDVFVTLTGMEDAKVDIFATNGELVRSEQVTNTGTFRIENLPVGFYMLKVTDSEGQTINKKIVIQ